MTTDEWKMMLDEIRQGKCRWIDTDEDGVPKIVKTMPLFELWEFVVALTKGYNKMSQRIEVQDWIIKKMQTKQKEAK